MTNLTQYESTLQDVINTVLEASPPSMARAWLADIQLDLEMPWAIKASLVEAGDGFGASYVVVLALSDDEQLWLGTADRYGIEMLGLERSNSKFDPYCWSWLEPIRNRLAKVIYDLTPYDRYDKEYHTIGEELVKMMQGTSFETG